MSTLYKRDLANRAARQSTQSGSPQSINDAILRADQQKDSLNAQRGMVKGNDGQWYSSQAAADTANTRLQASQIEAQNQMFQLQLDQRDLQSRLNSTTTTDQQNILKAMQTSSPGGDSFSGRQVSGAFDEDEYRQIVDLGTLQNNQKIDQINATGEWQQKLVDSEWGGRGRIADTEWNARKDISDTEAETNRYVTDVNTETNRYVTDSNNQTNRYVTDAQVKGQLDVATIGADTQKYTTDAQVTGQLGVAEIGADAQKYATDGQAKIADLQGKWNLDAVRASVEKDLAVTDKTIGGQIQLAGIQGQTAKDVAGIEAQGRLDVTRASGEFDVAKAEILGSYQLKGAEAAARGQIGAAAAQAGGMIGAAQAAAQGNIGSAKATAQGNVDTARVQGELQNIGFGIQGDYNERIANIEAVTNKDIAFGGYDRDRDVANITGEWTDKGYRTQGDEFRKTSAQESGQRIREQELARRGVQNSKREDGRAARNLYQQRAFG